MHTVNPADIRLALTEYTMNPGYLRFGQFFINNYMPPDTVWGTLFYEPLTRKALAMLLEATPPPLDKPPQAPGIYDGDLLIVKESKESRVTYVYDMHKLLRSVHCWYAHE